MSPTLDDLTIKFATYARNSKLDVLDIGCGDGIATAAVLQRGGHVLAVDAESGASSGARASSSEQYRRLKVRIGSVPASTSNSRISPPFTRHAVSPAEPV